ncbi:MAG TPA: hypothetical protein VGD31_17370 [Sphingobacteriaceae bacterium]
MIILRYEEDLRPYEALDDDGFYEEMLRIIETEGLTFQKAFRPYEDRGWGNSYGFELYIDESIDTIQCSRFTNTYKPKEWLDMSMTDSRTDAEATTEDYTREDLLNLIDKGLELILSKDFKEAEKKYHEIIEYLI